MLSSIKSFVIAFVVSLVVFGTLGYFAYPSIKSVSDDFLRPGAETDTHTVTETVTNGIVIPETSDPDSSIDPSKGLEGQKSFTLLIFGSDYQPGVFSDYRAAVSTSSDIDVLAANQRHYNAHVIMLVRYSAELGTVIFSAIPSNLTVNASGITMQLSEVLEKKNISYFIGMVESVTGLTIDYHVYCQISLMQQIIDHLGGIKFDVPADMYYVNEEERIIADGASRDPIIVTDDYGNITSIIPPGSPFKINLKKGIQKLNGEKASWVLRWYDTYPGGYNGYRETQTSFFKSFFEQFMKEEFRALLQKAITDINISNFGDTDITAEDFDEISKTLLNYSAYEKTAVTFPGSTSIISGSETISFSRQTVYETYAKYKLK